MQLTRILQLSVALIALATVGTWIATGAHRGWTQHKIPVTVVDEVTGIEATQYRDGFVAGVDVLGLGLGAAAILGIAAVFAARRAKPTDA